MPQIYSAVFLIYAKRHEVEYLIVSAREKAYHFDMNNSRVGN